MPSRPEIFVSATSKDLKSCRQLVRDALLDLGCYPIVQEHFPPDTRTVREMLRKKIAACRAVVHLVGRCYGAEPKYREENEERRSYTQLEYDVTRELGKPIYLFVCGEDFPYDKHELELDASKRELQRRHREAVLGSDQVRYQVADHTELQKTIGRLQERVDLLVEEMEGMERRHSEQNERMEAELTALRAKLDQQGQLSEQILGIVQQLSRGEVALVHRNAVSDAQAAVAKKQGITVAELTRQLAAEGADLRRLADDIATRRAAEHAQAEEWTRLEFIALTKLGESEQAAGRYPAAVKTFQKALMLVDEERLPHVWTYGAHRLGIALLELGRYAEAEPLMYKVVERRIKLLGSQHVATLASISDFALLLHYQGKLADAERLHRVALEIRERTLGADHRDTLNSVNNLALALAAQGNEAAAEPLYRRALAGKERVLGKDHSATLASVNNLAASLAARGDHAAAEELYRRAVKAYERTLGKDHPSTLTAISNLASLLHDQGDYAAAESLNRRVLDAFERTLGKDHPSTLTATANLACVLAEQGKYAIAQPLQRQVLQARERALGPNDPKTLSALRDLAALVRYAGDGARAEPLLRRVLDGYEQVFGTNDPSTLRVASDLASLLMERDDDANAEPLFDRVLDAQIQTLGHEHGDTAMTAYRFSQFWRKKGRWAHAYELGRMAVMAARTLFPADHPHRQAYERNFAEAGRDLIRK